MLYQVFFSRASRVTSPRCHNDTACAAHLGDVAVLLAVLLKHDLSQPEDRRRKTEDPPPRAVTPARRQNTEDGRPKVKRRGDTRKKQAKKGRETAKKKEKKMKKVVARRRSIDERPDGARARCVASRRAARESPHTQRHHKHTPDDERGGRNGIPSTHTRARAARLLMLRGFDDDARRAITRA